MKFIHAVNSQARGGTERFAGPCADQAYSLRSKSPPGSASVSSGTAST
jgi:hypothetical protein